MQKLCDLTCQACRGGIPPLDAAAIEPLHAQLSQWDVVDNHHLARTFTFPNFAKALAFVNRVGQIAEVQGHHPEINLTWGRVRIEIHTHKINGLTESDFILAARIDAMDATSP